MSKLTKLSAQWTHGEEGARKRLTEMIEKSERFDARDRMALAFLLAAEAPLRAALKHIAGCNGGEGYMPGLAKAALGDT